jgi:IBR domain, a half RING-finger domain
MKMAAIATATATPAPTNQSLPLPPLPPPIIEYIKRKREATQMLSGDAMHVLNGVIEPLELFCKYCFDLACKSQHELMTTAARLSRVEEERNTAWAALRRMTATTKSCMACLDTYSAGTGVSLTCCCPGADMCAPCFNKMVEVSTHHVVRCPSTCKGLVCPSMYAHAVTDKARLWDMAVRTSATERQAPNPTSGPSAAALIEFSCTTPDCIAMITRAAHSKLQFHPCLTCKSLICKDCMVTLDGHTPTPTGTICPATRPVAKLAIANIKCCPKPGCGMLLQKRGGCNAVCCDACGHYHCWLCGLLMEHRSEASAFRRAHAHFHGKAADPQDNKYHAPDTPCALLRDSLYATDEMMRAQFPSFKLH